MRSKCLASAALALGALGCAREPAAKREASPPAATSTPTTASPSGPNVVTYTATDYRFEGPTEVPAGLTELRLDNRGQEPHHLILVRLEQGMPFDSLAAALKRPGPPPRWIHPIGGPNGVSPGLESNAQYVLTPGTYGVLCMVPTVEGVPHFAKGMLSPLTVTREDRGGTEGTPDVVMRLLDYSFELSAPLRAGKQVIRVENTGPQLHEVVVARLNPGKTPADLVGWEMGGRKGEAPGAYIGGMSPLGPGNAAQFTADLKPGTYGLICFVPDAKDGKPHVAHGMLHTVTIE